MSRINWVGFEEKVWMFPLDVGTIAMLEVVAPSIAFNVETVG